MGKTGHFRAVSLRQGELQGLDALGGLVDERAEDGIGGIRFVTERKESPWESTIQPGFC